MTNYPDPKLDAHEKRLAERAQRHRHEILTSIQGDTHTAPPIPPITDALLEELIRRNREPAADAYGDQTGAGSNDVSRPTEATAIRNAGGRTTHDQHGNEIFTADTWQPAEDHVGAAINDFFAQLAEAAGVLTLARKRLTYILNVADTARGRISSLAGQCARCERDVSGAVGDKLVSGFCGACRKKWERTAYMDRLQFCRADDEKIAETIRQVRQGEAVA